MTEYILDRYNIEEECNQQLLEWADIDQDEKFKWCSLINLKSEEDTLGEQICETLDNFKDDFNSYDYFQDICRAFINTWHEDTNICYLEIFLEYKAEYPDDSNDCYCCLIDKCWWFICQEALNRQRGLIDLIECERNEAVQSIQRTYRLFKEKQRRQAIKETIENLIFPIEIEKKIIEMVI